MYCTNCGKPLNEGENFCKECGTKRTLIQKESIESSLKKQGTNVFSGWSIFSIIINAFALLLAISFVIDPPTDGEDGRYWLIGFVVLPLSPLYIGLLVGFLTSLSTDDKRNNNFLEKIRELKNTQIENPSDKEYLDKEEARRIKYSKIINTLIVINMILLLVTIIVFLAFVKNINFT